jgi:hypothetical protein
LTSISETFIGTRLVSWGTTWKDQKESANTHVYVRTFSLINLTIHRTLKMFLFMIWLRYQIVISLETQVGITSQRNNGITRTLGDTGGGIRCLRWVSIPCRPVTPAMSPVSWSWMRVIRCPSQCAKCSVTISMKNVRQHMAQWKFVIIN